MSGLEIAEPAPVAWAELYEAGATVAELRALTGHTHRYVVDQLRAQGVTFRPSHPRRPAWHAQAVELQARGWRPTEIARQLGKGASAVWHALRRWDARP